uniref:Uncharacterized protein n=1 Tax=Salix viminalis TaxID=40686 RepID=A0A6N2KN09_SALVM
MACHASINSLTRAVLVSCRPQAEAHDSRCINNSILLLYIQKIISKPLQLYFSSAFQPRPN